MKYCCVVIAFFLAALFKIATKKIYNPGTIFLTYWGVITLLSAMNLDNAVEVRESTYALILLGLVAFGMGCFLCLKVKHKPPVKADFDLTIKYYGILNIVCIAIIIYSLYRIGLIVSFLARGLSWGNIRMMQGVAGAVGSDTLKGGEWSQLIHDDFVGPCVYLLAPVLAVELFLGKRNKIFLALSAIAIALYSISTVSRAIWAFLILYLGIIFIAFYRGRVMSHRAKKWIKKIPLLAVVLFIVILGITKRRAGEGQVDISYVFYDMIAYLTGGINLFDIHMQEPLAEIRTYGFLSLFGFIQPFFFVLNYIGILKYPPVFKDVAYIKHSLERFIPISEHIRMNAYCTLFFNFYSDFGIIGVFLGSFLFGYFCMLSYTYFIRKKDLRTFVCYLILIQFMIFSMARIYTMYDTRALTLIWLLLLIPKDGKFPIRITFKR